MSSLRLVISGYYGFRNSGDEAVLLSILNALEQAGRQRGVQVAPVVLSADPAWTSRQYGVEAVPRMKPADVWAALRASDGLISGGGSLLQDATGMGSIPYYLGIITMARWCRKPVYIYAQGIGPVQRSIFRKPIAGAFRKAAYVSVRDEQSAALLASFGVPKSQIDVVPDPVMGMPLATQLQSDDEPHRNGDSLPIVGVSVRFWRSDRADLDRIAETLDALAERRRVRVRFLPLYEGVDEDASRYVMQRMTGVSAELAPAYEDPQQMLREVAACRLLIGVRLHSLIYGANREVPLLGISYDPKIDHFLARLGQQPIGTTEALDPERAADQAVAMLDDPAEWLAKVKPGIDRLKQEVLRPAQQIVASKRM